MKNRLTNICRWFIHNIYKNNYHLLALIFFILNIFLYLNINDFKDNKSMLIGYIISASSIYSAILFAYLLQKVSKINTSKEEILNNNRTVDLLQSLINYRFFCHLTNSLIKNLNHRQYNDIDKLNINIEDLIMIDNSMEENIDQQTLKCFNQYQDENKYALDTAIIIKYSQLFAKDIYDAVNTFDRTFSNNNYTINKYLHALINEGVFNRINDLSPSSSLKTEALKYFDKQLSVKKQYTYFKDKIDWDNHDVLKNLLLIERYILNKVLFRLHSLTFIIEKQLPNSTICLLANLTVILIFGTILPILNFLIKSQIADRICISTTILAITLSIIYIWNIFYDENNNDVHKYSSIYYEGKNT
ncbi:hypothetical protein [Sphingobacterium faecium]|uniref:hypothetical protein n=1 Tax=Sphingobacterium faecium TaxID=34087 RepID=UPI0024793297|nr:hypothetical protein [Sphingobacterium faecium]WGQ15032.1 hypothetical protein QG727_01185 [Sphingobacterium faecium]